MGNYYKPWISDEGPKPPIGWGVDAIRRPGTFKCNHCGEGFAVGNGYVYSFNPTIILHNTEECTEGLRG